MADPKFANLPGIAYDQPDVYETADNDIPEPSSTSDFSEDTDSEHIECLHISTKDSYNRFKGTQLTGNVDFSDRIGRKPRTGYQAVSGTWELSGDGEKETPLQKCRRLQCEINELLEEVSVLHEDPNASDQDKESYEAVGEIVRNSRRMLENLRLEQTLGNETFKHDGDTKKLLSQVNEFKKTNNIVSLPEDGPSTQSSRMAELDKRLYVLENAVGARPDKLSRLTGILGVNNVIETVQQLAIRAALLQPNNLDLIEERLEVLAQKMDLINSKSKGTGDESSELRAKEGKLDDLYDIAKRTEPIVQTLPEVLRRMQALDSLHKYANNFTKLIGELEATQINIVAGIGNNKKLLQKVQEAFAGNLENVNKEVAKLDSRLKALEG